MCYSDIRRKTCLYSRYYGDTKVIRVSLKYAILMLPLLGISFGKANGDADYSTTNV